FIAAASCAHISMYWASVAAIAGEFCPMMLEDTRFASSVRLAATTAGGTVIPNAASKAVAAAFACMPVCSACAAVALSHARYCAAAANIDADDGPIQPALLSSRITDS